MAEKFEHERLGRFVLNQEYGEPRWLADVSLPEFAVFRFRGNGRARRTAKVPVEIWSEAEPDQSALQMLLTIQRSQKALVGRIARAFFDDYNGIGPDSGMWWRKGRDPEQLASSCKDVLLKRLKREFISEADDFFLLLYEPSILIKPEFETEPGMPRTLVDFGAEFEVDHGVSVLTDGMTVLGLGYSDQADPYREI